MIQNIIPFTIAVQLRIIVIKKINWFLKRKESINSKTMQKLRYFKKYIGGFYSVIIEVNLIIFIHNHFKSELNHCVIIKDK